MTAPGDLPGSGIYATAFFTPAASAYGAADVIDVAKEFKFLYDNGQPVRQGLIIRLTTTILRIDQTAVISGETSYTLPLYRVTPPSAQADNAAWTLASADLPSYEGKLSLGTPVDEGAACFIKAQLTDQQDIRLEPTSNGLFGRLITVGAFTATAVARQVTLIGVAL